MDMDIDPGFLRLLLQEIKQTCDFGVEVGSLDSEWAIMALRKIKKYIEVFDEAYQEGGELSKK